MAGKRSFQTGLLLGQIELTERQSQFLEIMTDPDTRIVFLSGPAGTSKTFLSVYAALSLFNKNKKIRISYLRTIIKNYYTKY